MNRKNFNDCINDVLSSGNIEGIEIKNIDLIKNIVLEENLNNILFNGFKENYELEYDNDLSNFVMKVQDLLYRVNLLVNNILIDEYNIAEENNISNLINSLAEADAINLYGAVSYDDSDMEELHIDLDLDFKVDVFG